MIKNYKHSISCVPDLRLPHARWATHLSDLTQGYPSPKHGVHLCTESDDVSLKLLGFEKFQSWLAGRDSSVGIGIHRRARVTAIIRTASRLSCHNSENFKSLGVRYIQVCIPNKKKTRSSLKGIGDTELVHEILSCNPPLPSSTMVTSLRSSALSTPADTNLAWWLLERGNELKGRCMLEPRACSIFPPALQVLVDAHLVPQADVVSVPDLIRAAIASSIPPRKTVWGTAYLQFVPCPGMCGDRKLT